MDPYLSISLIKDTIIAKYCQIYSVDMVQYIEYRLMFFCCRFVNIPSDTHIVSVLSG